LSGKSDVSETPGVGRKKAERLILELRGKIVEKERKETLSSDTEQAIEVLLSLGFTKKEANSRIRSVLQENEKADLETLVRKSIKY
jgi:Holliday junction DNA helicase RuvA